MNKITATTVIVLAVSAQLTAQEYQYVPFPDSGVVWSEVYYVHDENSDEKTSYECFTVNGEDTIINGQAYTKVYHFKDSIFNKNTAICIGGIREDSLKRVYYKGEQVHSLKPQLQYAKPEDEIILFDFNIEEGDTIDFVNSDAPGMDRFIVSIIDTVEFSGVLRKQFFFKEYDSSLWGFSWIEGIGSTRGLLFISGTIPMSRNNRLICFFENEELVFHDTDYTDCFIKSSNKSFIDTTKVWIVSNRVVTGDSYGYPTTLQFRFGGDSILEGVTYAKMNVNKGADQWNFHSLWREDELGNVYCKDGIPKEYLIYNFSIETGDSLFLRGLEIVVDSTAIKPFGSKNKKHINSRYLDVPGHVITWIEGVGSLYGPDVSDHYFLVGGISTLICFEENNEHVYLNPLYTACNAQSGTSVPEIENKNRFEIKTAANGEIKFINPTSNNGTLSFITVDGKIIKRYKIASYEGTIHFPYTGLFLYRFESEKTQLQSGRVLVK